MVQVPERVSVAAGQMMMTITHAVRPHHLTQIPAVQKFIVLGSKGEFNILPLVVGLAECFCACSQPKLLSLTLRVLWAEVPWDTCMLD